MTQRSKTTSRFANLPERLARVVTDWAGSSQAFAIAVATLVLWALSGPALPLLGHLAARHQHRHHHRHLPDGVPHPALQNKDARAMT